VASGELWRLVASIFLHGGWAHFALNTLSLFFVGRYVEAFYGSWKTLFLFLVSGLTGSFASAMTQDGLSVGASGAVFGLAGTAIVFAFRYREVLPERVTWSARTVLLPLLALNVVAGFLIPRIDMMAHLGGLVAGAVATLMLSPDALDEARTGKAPESPRHLAAFSLVLLAVTFVYSGVSFFRTMTGDELADVTPEQILLEHQEGWEELDETERLFTLGQWHTLAGRWERALRDYRTLLTHDPDDARALNNLAWLLLEEVPPELRDPEEALRLAERAVELEPDDPYALGTLATARLRTGDAGSAEPLFERALADDGRLRSEEAVDRYLLSIALVRLGRAEEAEDEYRHAVRLDDESRYRSEAEAELGAIQSDPAR
jgi:rhomboid protease GluP